MAILDPKKMARNGSVLSYGFAPTTAAQERPALRAMISGGTTLLSTGGDPLTVPYDVDDKIGFLVTWLATAATTGALTVAHGSERRGWQKDIGSYTLTMTAAGATGRTYFVGPFETARFAIKSTSTEHAPVGRNYVRFTGSTAALVQSRRFNIVAFRMPDVQYDT